MPGIKTTFPSSPWNQSSVAMQQSSRQWDGHGSYVCNFQEMGGEGPSPLPPFLLPVSWNADMRAGVGAAIFLRIAKQQDKKEALCQSSVGAFYT